MAAEVKKEIELEIAHVLFLDIVGYSRLSVNEQHARVEELNEIVRLSEQFRKAQAANRILKIPTGDGMALVFYKSPEEPAQCAFEISRALKEHPRLKIRMGIHSGPVSGVVDVNERTNVAGAGINIARRVMDCGDAGHILLSHHVAEDLAEYERWRPFLHDIGTFEVKHGVRVSVTNLYSDEVGNPNLPKKLEAVRKHRAHVRWAEIAIGLLVLGAIVAAFMIVSRRPTTSLTALPEKSIAVLPFVDMSEDKSNEYFSDGISEELLNLLAKIPQLQVTARTSSFSFKGKEIGVPEIARTLHVAHVLEGSVRKAGNSVRITAQLIKAGTDTHLWSQTYDRKLDDIFAIQDEIAADVVRAGSQLRQRDRPRPSARQGRIRPSPRGGREGAYDRSGLRTGPCPARLDRDVRRQRPRRCRAALRASARDRSGGPECAYHERHAAPVSRSPRRGAGARRGRRPPRSGGRDGALQPGLPP